MALVLLGGCSAGDGSPTTPSPTAASTAPSPSGPAASPSSGLPATPAPSTSPSASPSGTSTGLVPGADCLTGTWRLVRFVGLGEQSTYGTGQGGDVTVAFDGGRYTLVGRGQEPITVILAGTAAELRIDGTVDGTYRPDGAEMSFTVGRATGQGTLQAGEQRQTIPMAQVAQVVAPSGKATLACPSGVLLIALPTVRLELER
jgi:hypothetical protein